MTNFQKWLVHIKQFVFVISFLQALTWTYKALEWIYQKIMIMKNKLVKLLDNKQVNYCHSCVFLRVKNPKKAVYQLKDEEFTFLPSCIPHSEYQIGLVWREHKKQIDSWAETVKEKVSTGKSYWGKVLFIAGARGNLKEKETVWKRIQKNYPFLEKIINNYTKHISTEIYFLEKAREIVN